MADGLHYTRCPVACTQLSTEEEQIEEMQLKAHCRCSVPDEYISIYGAKKMIQDINIDQAFSHYFTDDTQDDFYLTVLRALEDPGVVGEMFFSAGK